MRYGVYGGSFDPIHFGHLLLAEICREEMNLDEIIFVPAGIPPHKRNCKRASDEHRIHMLELAIKNSSFFQVDLFEINAKTVNYTVDTLEFFCKKRHNDECFLIVGADMINDMIYWKDPKKICELASLITAYRPGFSAPNFMPFADFVSAEKLSVFKKQIVSMPQIDISSSEIRKRINAGKSIEYQTPHEVVEYIKEQLLYRQ